MEKRKKQILDLYFKGFNYTQIGEIFHLSRQRIHQICQNYHTVYGNSKIRKQVFNRDNFECQWREKCDGSKDKDLVIHHIDLISGNNRLNNLITLCTDCHIFFHQLEKEENTKKQCPECLMYVNRKELYVSKHCKECRKNNRN